jgi:hypothetical protein
LLVLPNPTIDKLELSVDLTELELSERECVKVFRRRDLVVPQKLKTHDFHI